MADKQTTPSAFRGAIVAMTRDRIIGVDGKLPWHYSEDLKRFKQRTMGCAIIMGRVTWDSIQRKALPGRRNIVISRSEVEGVECYDSIEPAIAACENQDLWIIGGAQIYQATFEFVNLLDITWVPDLVGEGGVVRFPRIDWDCWTVEEEKVLPGDSRLRNAIYRRERSDRVSTMQFGV